MTNNVGGTIGLRTKRRLVVFVNLDQPPTDLEWSAYLAAAREAYGAYGPVCVLVVTEGGPPSAKQRKAAGELSTAITFRTALVTNSLVARAVVTGFGWLKLDIKAFAHAEMTKAFAFLQLSPTEREWAYGTVRQMQAELRAGQAKAAP